MAVSPYKVKVWTWKGVGRGKGAEKRHISSHLATPRNMNLNALSNMNARSACPKCDGYGYIHDTLDKHDKPDRRTRCKKCNDCQVCSGSGVVVGKAACRTCKARGFIHAGSTRHTINEFVMCEQCLVCKDCIAGIPRHIAKKLPKAAPAFLENPQDLPSHASAPHLDARPSIACGAWVKAGNTSRRPNTIALQERAAKPVSTAEPAQAKEK
ncbi:hypothetical protein BC830DRAFT_241692 [Chytriomyces sp. MP71]|nr:hypothetical protein BC830DRAFT_241692 [Chytriomyces sp. MP71]